MILYPKFYLNNVKEIDMNFLKTNNIKGLLLDVDNTLIDKEQNLLDGVIQWCKELKEYGIKVGIISNTSDKKKVEGVAEKLDIPYLFFVHKPFKSAFVKGKKMLNMENNKEIAAVGDQIFTDVLGANRSGVISILVNPISKKDLWYTKIKRPFEKLVIKGYYKKYGGN